MAFLSCRDGGVAGVYGVCSTPDSSLLVDQVMFAGVVGAGSGLMKERSEVCATVAGVDRFPEAAASFPIGTHGIVVTPYHKSHPVLHYRSHSSVAVNPKQLQLLGQISANLNRCIEYLTIADPIEAR